MDHHHHSEETDELAPVDGVGAYSHHVAVGIDHQHSHHPSTDEEKGYLPIFEPLEVSYYNSVLVSLAFSKRVVTHGQK